MLYGYMFEEIRQMGAVSRALYGLEELGEEQFHGKSLNFGPQINETYFVKAVENFVVYYVGIIAVIFILHPKALFEKKFDIRLAFETDTIDELRFHAIEHEVNSLSYKGILDLAGIIEKKTNFSLFETDFQTRRAARLMAIRNLLVHNRGIVNRRYIQNSANRSLKPGSDIQVPNNLRVRNWLGIQARMMDHRFREKFDVPKDYLRWRND